MKFTWFNLMPWPYLPDDFREKNRSVWVDIDSQLFDPAKGHQVYNNYLDLLEYAASLGFDGIGMNEHHQNAYGLMPSPNIIAASLARRTDDVALVVLGARPEKLSASGVTAAVHFAGKKPVARNGKS